MRLVAVVITIVGGLPVLLGTASCGLSSVPDESVSMSVAVALRGWGAKNLLVATYLEGCRRCGRHCFLRSSDCLFSTLPLPPPDFLETFLLGG
jgi:hypothetical protein